MADAMYGGCRARLAGRAIRVDSRRAAVRPRRRPSIRRTRRSPYMSLSRPLALLAPLAVLAAGVNAAPLTPAQRTCQDATARGGRKLLEGATALVADCTRDLARGRLPPGASCSAGPSIAQALDAAAAKALQPIARDCTDADVAAIAPAGVCRGGGPAVARAR